MSVAPSDPLESAIRSYPIIHLKKITKIYCRNTKTNCSFEAMADKIAHYLLLCFGPMEEVTTAVTHFLEEHLETSYKPWVASKVSIATHFTSLTQRLTLIYTLVITEEIPSRNILKESRYQKLFPTQSIAVISKEDQLNHYLSFCCKSLSSPLFKAPFFGATSLSLNANHLKSTDALYTYLSKDLTAPAPTHLYPFITRVAAIYNATKPDQIIPWYPLIKSWSSGHPNETEINLFLENHPLTRICERLWPSKQFKKNRYVTSSFRKFMSYQTVEMIKKKLKLPKKTERDLYHLFERDEITRYKSSYGIVSVLDIQSIYPLIEAVEKCAKDHALPKDKTARLITTCWQPDSKDQIPPLIDLIHLLSTFINYPLPADLVDSLLTLRPDIATPWSLSIKGLFKLRSDINYNQIIIPFDVVLNIGALISAISSSLLTWANENCITEECSVLSPFRNLATDITAKLKFAILGTPLGPKDSEVKENPFFAHFLDIKQEKPTLDLKESPTHLPGVFLKGKWRVKQSNVLTEPNILTFIGSITLQPKTATLHIPLLLPIDLIKREETGLFKLLKELYLHCCCDFYSGKKGAPQYEGQPIESLQDLLFFYQAKKFWKEYQPKEDKEKIGDAIFKWLIKIKKETRLALLMIHGIKPPHPQMDTGSIQLHQKKERLKRT